MGLKALVVVGAALGAVGVYFALGRTSRTPPPSPDDAPAPEPAPPVVPEKPKIPPFPGLEPLTVGIHAVVLSDGDGGRATGVTAREIETAVAEARRIYAAANVHFEFDPSTDITWMEDTQLNSINTRKMAKDIELRWKVNRIAARFPESITVLYRWGKQAEPTTNGFSSVRMNSVVMPIYSRHVYCGEPRSEGLAHEMGHYLGLRHTFSGAGFPTMEDADAAREERELGPSNFDGDGMESTPPDPFIREFACDPPANLSLGGIDYAIPRDNIMSYYYPTRGRLTLSQAERLRWALAHRLRRGMVYGTTQRPRDPLEGEALSHSQTGPCRKPKIRKTKAYFKRGWSGDAYLELLGEPGCQAELTFEVSEPGPYELRLWATQGPGSGIVNVALDGAPIEERFDLFATVRTPAGPLELGVHELDAGEHRIELRAPEKNDHARAHFVGVDAITLSRVPDAEN